MQKRLIGGLSYDFVKENLTKCFLTPPYGRQRYFYNGNIVSIFYDVAHVLKFVIIADFFNEIETMLFLPCLLPVWSSRLVKNNFLTNLRLLFTQL